MPIDHDAAGMPLGHQVAIPASELRGIPRASRTGITPDHRIANCKCGIGNASAGFVQGARMDEAAVHMQKLLIAGVSSGAGNPLQTGIGAKAVEAKKQSLLQGSLRQRGTGGRCFERIEKPGIEGCFLQNIE